MISGPVWQCNSYIMSEMHNVQPAFLIMCIGNLRSKVRAPWHGETGHAWLYQFGNLTKDCMASCTFTPGIPKIQYEAVCSVTLKLGQSHLHMWFRHFLCCMSGIPMIVPMTSSYVERYVFLSVSAGDLWLMNIWNSNDIRQGRMRIYKALVTPVLL